MYALNSQEYELDVISTTQVWLFLDSSESIESENDGALSAAASSEVFRGMARNVISRSEITAIFDYLKSKNESLDRNKLGIMNFYYFVCTLTC